ncbi:hypothetical protein ACJMK2_023381 [Sinanodonta woodiana]|uniref:Uncharacterized protein n=1 Tax=Sinanodonta woodiana TaxID=1069815 RepID=A0ABD3T4R4_SINWO
MTLSLPDSPAVNVPDNSEKKYENNPPMIVLYMTSNGIYCNATWDTILCWPAARAGTTVRLSCPPLPGLDTTKYGYRTCSPDGRWEGKIQGDYSNLRGYTNYTNCYTPEAYEVYKKFFLTKTPAEIQTMRDIVSGTRTMEIVGLWLSLVTCLLSLFIFSYFRSLRCHRTRIHRNLFVALIVQISVRLIVYVDQFVARLKGGEVGGAISGGTGAIYDTPVLCETLYSLLEYTKTVTFMWMLIEGVYLHNMIAVSVFSKKPNYVVFYAAGWGFPVLVTLAWVVIMAIKYKTKCWFPYYFLPYIWILEVPRIAVILVNLLFLLNIIRVLVLKLQDSHNNEAQVVKVRKAIKAALLLLPLLGITNFVVMIEAPTDDVLKFGVWSYSSHFLVSFQGSIISVLYCFLNGEVQMVFSKRWERFLQTRMVHSSSLRRMSRSLSMFTSFTEVPQNQYICCGGGSSGSGVFTQRPVMTRSRNSQVPL